MNARLKEIKSELVAITEGCRPDMHEPDEQNLKARVVGYHLDNACGGHIGSEALIKGHQEFVVCLERFREDAPTGSKIQYARINLADLIALARQ